MMEKILDYEFADKDGDGKPDNKKLAKQIESLSKTLVDGQKVALSIYDGRGSNTSFAEKEINLDLYELKNIGTIDPETGYVCPLSLNTVFVHELDHLTHKRRPEEKIGELKNKIADIDKLTMDERNDYIRSFDDRLDKKKITDGEVNKLVEDRYPKALMDKMEDRQDKYEIRLEKLENRLESKTPFQERDMGRYKKEHSGVEEEFDTRNLHNEPKRSPDAYMAGYILNEPLKEVIYYTSDDQKYTDNYVPVQKITKKDLAELKLDIENENVDEKTKEKWLKEIEKLEKKLERRGDISNLDMDKLMDRFAALNNSLGNLDAAITSNNSSLPNQKSQNTQLQV